MCGIGMILIIIIYIPRNFIGFGEISEFRLL